MWLTDYQFNITVNHIWSLHESWDAQIPWLPLAASWPWAWGTIAHKSISPVDRIFGKMVLHSGDTHITTPTDIIPPSPYLNVSQCRCSPSEHLRHPLKSLLWMSSLRCAAGWLAQLGNSRISFFRQLKLAIHTTSNLREYNTLCSPTLEH